MAATKETKIIDLSVIGIVVTGFVFAGFGEVWQRVDSVEIDKSVTRIKLGR
jgi:hypothetical protein